jgi:hypothetical protein
MGLFETIDTTRIIMTLALSLQPIQGLAKVRAEKEA